MPLGAQFVQQHVVVLGEAQVQPPPVAAVLLAHDLDRAAAVDVAEMHAVIGGEDLRAGAPAPHGAPGDNLRVQRAADEAQAVDARAGLVQPRHQPVHQRDGIGKQAALGKQPDRDRGERPVVFRAEQVLAVGRYAH